MDIVSLREVVDLRAVKYLNSMPKAWWKEILNTDKDRKFEVEYKKVKSFLSGQLDGTGITRQYKYADGKTFGRQFDHSGLQGTRSFKQFLWYNREAQSECEAPFLRAYPIATKGFSQLMHSILV